MSPPEVYFRRWLSFQTQMGPEMVISHS